MTALYTNVLGRAPDAAGLAFWNSQGYTAARLLEAFAQSAEFITQIAPQITAFENLEIAGTPPTTGSFFEIATAANRTFALTLGADNITGSGFGGDTINAPVLFNPGTGTQIQSLQSGDTITETGANNILNANFNNLASSTITGITISGVQTFNFTNLGAAPQVVGGTITGVTTLNNVGSSSGIQLGGGATPALTAALTGIGVTNSNASTAAAFTTAALAGAADSLAVTVSGAGASATPVVIGAFVDGGTTANGYETFAFTETCANFVQLRGANAGTVNNTTKVTFAGSGSLTIINATGANSFSKISVVDGSTATGDLNITGQLLAGGFGLLNGDVSLTSIKTGTGADVVDISSMALANFTANATTVDLGTGANSLIVSNSLATTTSALSGITNVPTLGVVGAVGTIDMSKLPASVTTLLLSSAQGGALTINNGANGLTFNEASFSGGFAHNVTAAGSGTSDVFTDVLGTSSASDTTGALTVTGYETINLNAFGPAGGTDNIGAITATASLGGNMTLNIGGTVNFNINGSVTLNGNGTAFTDTNAGVVTINGGINAVTINAATSGGLFMTSPDTGNAGLTGVSITGSALKQNVLIGSLGNDVFVGGTASNTSTGDYIATNGGADSITLGAAGKIDHVFLSVGTFSGTTFTATPATIETGAAGITQQGFWGNAPGATSPTIGHPNTSASMSVINNFTAGATGDVVHFSVGGWQSGAIGNGLNTGDLRVTSHPVVGDAVVALQNIGTSVASGVSLIELAQGTYANAAAVATALHNTYNLDFAFGTGNAAFDAHVLVAYNDTTGSVRIADVALYGNVSNSSLVLTESVSDMVQLVGVSLSALHAHNVNFIA